ncbi:MAG: AMP-binding protein [Ilumatobacteraceae bacterium]
MASSSRCRTRRPSSTSCSRCSASARCRCSRCRRTAASSFAHFCAHTDAVALVTTGRDGRTDLRPLAAELLATSPALRHVVLAGDTATADAAGQPDGVVDLPTLVAAAAPVAADARRAATDVAFLQLSGGSTGVPKLIPRTHAEYAYSVRESAAICGLSPATVFLAAIPVAHNFTLSSPGTLGVFHAGGRVVLAADPSPDNAFALIERHQVTIAPLVPPLALLWIDAAPRTAHDLSSLEVVQVGGANFDPAAAAQLGPALGCRLQQVFGMAEGLVNYTRFDDPDELVVGTQGRPISPHDELLVVDDDDLPVPPGVVGHLLTRGPYTIRGYYRAAEHNAWSFTADGFYRTGDLVRVRPDGSVVVEGRHKDVVNRGGEKIAAAEVEEHLRAHPSVHDVALIGVPDRLLGERSCAVVVPAGEPPSRVALRRFLVDRGLATYKLPDRLEIVGELPKTGVGKVAKNVLRERFGRPSPTERVEEP